MIRIVARFPGLQLDHAAGARGQLQISVVYGFVRIYILSQNCDVGRKVMFVNCCVHVIIVGREMMRNCFNDIHLNCVFNMKSFFLHSWPCRYCTYYTRNEIFPILWLLALTPFISSA